MSTSSPSTKVPPKVAYLRSLPSIRERCSKVFSLAQQGKLDYFDYDVSKESEVVDYCASIIERDFGTDYASIPPHGRWRHFDVGPLPRITTLLSRWAGALPSPKVEEDLEGSKPKPVPAIEAARRLVDLFMVSVLLDAGAGTKWKYEEKRTGLYFSRSEGLAVASLDMFVEGRFCGQQEESESKDRSGDHLIGSREKVEAKGLKNLTEDDLAMDMQVHPTENPMTGIKGRSELLTRLGEAIESDENGFFVGPDPESDRGKRRPGFLVDYLASHPLTVPCPTPNNPTKLQVPVPVLWEVLIYGLAPIWPASRTTLEGVAMGDAWPCSVLGGVEKGEQAIVPFHKLSQWMCYSIMEPIEKTLGWEFVGGDHQTGLPEYRNGGLFVDLGVLKPKPSLLESSQPPVSKEEYEVGAKIPRLEPSHPAVVEWRAMTVILLDRTSEAIRSKLKLQPEQLVLKQVLESATWKGGREIAAKKRPQNGGGPPIEIISDGTVF
ncbi:DUF1688-domain-containing protein [Violaceomyces palustris]|uniref:DUF1688-domain-containing protein n=1 Tax=Violaceomyces palustris TaxID=1673888 RepID=A0ACD0NMP3_9BASI|nr:DUF1688-domain-containing protein [Violaceomyces palustris]